MSVNFNNTNPNPDGPAFVQPPGGGSAGSSEPWGTKDIVYLSIICPIVLAALLEWFLFMASFDYCLVKIFQKAEHWSTRVLAVVIMILFTALRVVFLPVIIFTLPLPPRITKYFPPVLVSFLTWFAFWAFSALLIFPWLLCLFRIITHNVGKKRKIKHVLNESSAPKVVVVMPVYNEEPQVLLTAINSVVDCDYPATCLHVFLSFDGDAENELYLSTVQSLGVEMMMTYPKCIDIMYKGARITLSRFPHGGKRSCQKKTYGLIDTIYKEYLKRNDNLFILFIDSDCVLDRVCIQNFMYEMELKPGSDRSMLAMTGVITCTTRSHSFLSILQDIEYIHGQLFERSVESACGAVTCLPGALTMLRFSAFRKMSKYYFSDRTEECDDLFDYAKCHLGEDRWLTHLFMVGAKKAYQIQMCNGAFCKTEAVQTFKSLLKQRRRWFLGSVTNEACMLTDARLWYRYPVMCLYRFMQCTIRTTALLFFILILAMCSTEASINNLPIGFIAVSLGLNWILMFFFGIVLGRYKVWLYPMMFVVNPFFNFIYMTYGSLTAGKRTWGGPRADAAVATEKITPQQAIEKAKATGDDLNIVPESFKPAIATYNPQRQYVRRPVLPPSRVEGRFAAPDLLPGGWYMQPNASRTTSVHDAMGLNLDENSPLPSPRFPYSHGDSGLSSPTESRFSLSSYINEDNNGIYRAKQVPQHHVPMHMKSFEGSSDALADGNDDEVLMTEDDFRKFNILRQIKDHRGQQNAAQITEVHSEK